MRSSAPQQHRSAHLIIAFVERRTVDVRRHLGDPIHAHRVERVARWTSAVARLWEETPSVVYQWLSGDTPVWDSFPILVSAGAQCTTMEEVDHARQNFWVQRVWRMHAEVLTKVAELLKLIEEAGV